MDCMEGMKTFPDKYFDLAIVDPPYGIGASDDIRFGLKTKLAGSKRTNYDKKDWDFATPNQDYFYELLRISKNQIIWGANYFGLIGSILFWHKNNTSYTSSSGELAFLSFKKSIDYVYLLWHGAYQEDMKNKEIRIHPTQKPVQLYKWILHKYAKHEMKIIDTHVGSASSIIAFLDFGCDWIGFEIDKDYHKAASERIEIHKKRPKPFFTDVELADKNIKQKGFF